MLIGQCQLIALASLTITLVISINNESEERDEFHDGQREGKICKLASCKNIKNTPITNTCMFYSEFVLNCQVSACNLTII